MARIKMQSFINSFKRVFSRKAKNEVIKVEENKSLRNKNREVKQPKKGNSFYRRVKQIHKVGGCRMNMNSSDQAIFFPQWKKLKGYQKA